MTNLNNENTHIEILIYEYLKGTISDIEKNQLFRWLSTDIKNIAYFNQISDIWLSSSVFETTQEFNADEAFTRVRSKIKDVNALVTNSKFRTIRLSWQKAAAILLPIILLSSLVTKILVSGKSSLSDSPFRFEVPYGSKSTVILPDGSRVVLNSGSRLTCNEGFGKTHRNLNLVGEGYFTVAKNKDLPFFVYAGNLNIRALGTEFNVKAYPEDKVVETILVHGSIQINKTSNKGVNEKLLILEPKQVLVYNKLVDSIHVNGIQGTEILNKNSMPASSLPEVVFAKTNIDPVIYTTWKDESWKIYRKNLEELAVELERNYDVKIHFKNELLKKIKFTGTLKDESLEQVLAAIRMAAPIEYKINGKIVELSENKELMQNYKQYFSN